MVALSNDNDRLASFCLELVGALSVKVVLDNGVKTGDRVSRRGLGHRSPRTHGDTLLFPGVAGADVGPIMAVGECMGLLVLI